MKPMQQSAAENAAPCGLVVGIEPAQQLAPGTPSSLDGVVPFACMRVRAKSGFFERIPSCLAGPIQTNTSAGVGVPSSLAITRARACAREKHGKLRVPALAPSV
jgi:hypothetical protein